eukprot:11673116-Ditylum_brightwellii.AAC.1
MKNKSKLEQASKKEEAKKSDIDSPRSNALVSKKAKFLQEEAFKKKENKKQAKAGAPGNAMVCKKMK